MRKKILLGITAALLIAIAAFGIGKAYAYFTTYVEAKGQRTIRLGDETTIEENYGDWKKDVQITNSADSAKAVWVRAQAFAGSEYKLGYNGKGSGSESWTDEPDADGWYYFSTPIAPGESTKTLTISITDLDGNKPAAEDGKTFNVVVVYETTPAVENGEEGGKTQYLPADWSLPVTNTTAASNAASDSAATDTTEVSDMTGGDEE